MKPRKRSESFCLSQDPDTKGLYKARSESHVRTTSRSLCSSPVRIDKLSNPSSPDISPRNPLRFKANSKVGSPRFVKPKSFSPRRNSTSEDLLFDNISEESGSVSSPRIGFHQIDFRFSEVQLYEKIGEGASAEVFSGNINGFSLAVKIYQGIEISEIKEDVVKEITIMEQIYHPKIIRCLGHKFSEPDKMMLFMEMCHGTLRDLIDKQRTQKNVDKYVDGPNPFSSIEILYYLKQIAEGLCFLHLEIKPKIIHRDLKSENIFYTKCWDKKLPDLKIGDFGEALLKVKKQKKKVPNLGTLEFRAPEMMSSKKDNLVKYDEKVDIWSFGMILYELLTLDVPYRREFGTDFIKIESAITIGQRPKINTHGSRIRHKILPILYESCTHRDPKLRPNSKEIIDKFLNKFNKKVSL